MKQVHSPVLIALSALALGLGSAVLVLWLALSQPWLGLYLVPDTQGRGTVISLHPDSPAAGLIAPGARLLDLRAAGADPGTALALEAADLIEEPDALPGPDALRRFLFRQGEIHARLSAPSVTLSVIPPGEETVTEVTLVPDERRPRTDLPWVFWIQIGVGLTGLVLGGWILSLRVTDRAVQFFALAGAGLMISAHAAALYSTRELALGQGLFTAASRLNYAGTLGFGIGMINLFLIYPARLARPWALWAVAVVLGGCVLAVLLDAPDALLNRQAPVALAMLVLLGAVLVQVAVNRRNPTARAMLGWFGLSVLLGAGGFGLTVTLPILLGATPSLSQGHAFLFFLVIYGGLAMGIARYRLFDLADWSFRILFYLGGVVLMLALDAALILLLSLDRAPALGLALALVGVAYLPLRDMIARRLGPERTLPREALFALIGDVTLANGSAQREAALNALLARLFDPLQIEQGPPAPGAARLEEGGEVLDIPLPQGLPRIRLHWARQGRSLFTRRDERLAQSVTEMLDRAIARQRSHDRAVEEERSRINRDMHDNIGVQLLGALHSRDMERKDVLIRQTLSDLRQIISTPAQERMVLSRLLGDLRREIGDHLEAAGIDLDWQDADLQDGGLTAPETPDVVLSPVQVQSLRALLRESTSNILRHSGARTVRISLARTQLPGGPALHTVIEDDGTGQQTEWRNTGNGLANLRFRIEGCGGTLKIGPAGTGADTGAGTGDETGTRIETVLPLGPGGAVGAIDRAAG